MGDQKSSGAMLVPGAELPRNGKNCVRKSVRKKKGQVPAQRIPSKGDTPVGNTKKNG